MSQTKRTVIWVVVILSLVLCGWIGQECLKLFRERSELRDKVSQLQNTLAHSTIELQHDTISLERPVVKQSVVVIDKTDYKRLEADEELIKELKLKIGQVESENRTLLATQGQVIFKTAVDSDSILRYTDRWADFTYHVKPRTLDYCVRDSLTTIVSRVPKHKFLFWRWGVKGYDVHIVSHNPNAIIEYNRFIKVEK